MSRYVFFAIGLTVLAANDFVPAQTVSEKASPWVFKADPELPNVLIVGDSISIGYTLAVRRELQTEANVYRPMSRDGRTPVNCGSTYLTLSDKRIDAILAERPWAVIHFNWGLWEIACRNPPNKRTEGDPDKINGDVSITPEEYEKNLEVLVEKMKKTGATLIWATTTVVPDGDTGRRIGDEMRYNDVAEKVMKKHGVRTNDLHTLSREFKPELFTQPGNVHYTSAGYKQLGLQVAESVRQALFVTVHGLRKVGDGFTHPSHGVCVLTNAAGISNQP